MGEEENRRARSRARLRAVPQDGHASEEIERAKAEGKLGMRRERGTGKDSSSRLSPVSLSANSLSPVLPSLDSTD